MTRIILHCDLDCFYAAVEIRDNPELKGKPVVIGADPRKGKARGVALTCSYEARVFGIHSGMPISSAYKACPDAIFVSPDFEKIRDASKKVMEILKTPTPQFQQMGMDEAYLDVSDTCNDYKEAEDLARRIQREVFEKVGISISIGVAPTKSISKIASDQNKPNGICVVEPGNLSNFLKDLDITRIPGIGKKSKKYYNNKGFHKIGDFIQTPLPQMNELFGKHGRWIYEVVNGLDTREVKDFHGKRKSISSQRTFHADTDDHETIFGKFEEINNNIHKTLQKNRISYRTITLRIRFEDFSTYTRSKSFQLPIRDKRKAFIVLKELYKEFSNHQKKVRLVGVKFSNLERYETSIQTNLTNFAVI